MGNSTGRVTEEFNRIAAGSKSITFHQILSFDCSKVTSAVQYHLSLTHLGTLYVLNKEKTGVFTLDELLAFVAMCAEPERIQTYRQHDFATMIRAYCTLCLWEEVTTDQGQTAFADWFTLLLERDTQAHVAEVGGKVMVHEETIRLLHSVFCLEQAYGIGVADFMRLLTMSETRAAAGDVVGTPREPAAAAPEWAPMSALHKFAKHFIGGFADMMSSLGFDASKKYF